MKLSDFLQALPQKRVVSFSDREITEIVYDSRMVEQGALFVAIPGLHVDGHFFIPEAVAKGAVAVVAQEGRPKPNFLPTEAPLVLVPDTRLALAQLAAAFYSYPSRRLKVIGVTGTDGKTTTTYLISALLEAGGHPTGLLSTVAFKIGDKIEANDTLQTTPEAPKVQAILAEMVAQGMEYAVVESTSHALALDRVACCEYDAAVITNVSSDHLDFHGTWEEYFAAKTKLFRLLGEAVDKGIPKVSVLNADDPSFPTLKSLAPGQIISYGIQNPATITATDITPWARLGTIFRVLTPQGEITIRLKLPGLYNVYNTLAALAIGLSQGVSLERIQSALENMAGVPGRMERVEGAQPFDILVDYAHNPHALEKALGTLRPMVPGKLIVVFGCAGDRDRARRWGMGRVAATLADFAVLTTDDPRFEDPKAIADEIAAGIKDIQGEGASDYAIVLDRRQAIRFAFQKAGPGDVVLLAGKGHEQRMLVANGALPWDERTVALATLEELGY